MIFLANWLVCKFKGHEWVEMDGKPFVFHNNVGHEVHYCNRCNTIKEVNQ